MLCNDCPVAPFQRETALESMAETTYDLVVVGAGMTGSGVALDAASRGLRVALIDGGDIASGTSSKSSKMVHGGLRYLQQREFRLVYENLRDLNFEYKAGKVPDADYQSMRTSLEEEAAAIMAEIARLERAAGHAV